MSVVNYRRSAEDPVSLLSNLLKNELNNQFVLREDYRPVLLRAMVVAIDLDGGKLEGPYADEMNSFYQTVFDVDGNEHTYEIAPMFHDCYNPPDSIKAKIMDPKFDMAYGGNTLRTFWPLFPGLMNPSPGELVYVLFEDENMQRGVWLSKVPVSNDSSGPVRVQLNFVMTNQSGSNGSVMGRTFGDTPTSTTVNPQLPIDDEGLNRLLMPGFGT